MRPNFFKTKKNNLTLVSRRKLLKINRMVFPRFLSFSMLCQKNNSSLWFDDLWALGILELTTTLKIK